MKMLIKGFCPDCRALLTDIDECQIDEYIAFIEEKLEFIKNGADVDE